MTLALATAAWMASAVCASTDPELFFPDPGGSERAVAAKSICAGCSVQVACLTYAIERPELVGVWGGATERTRRELRRQGRAAA